MPGWLPAALITIGTITDSPRPTTPKPAMLSAGQGLNSATSMPSVASEPRPRSNGASSMRPRRRSPNRRPTTIAAENAAKPSAATRSEASRTLCRNSALQSATPPSETNAQRISRPRPSKARGGKVKPPPLRAPALLGSGGSNARTKNGRLSRPSAVRMRKCQNGVSPASAAALNAPTRQPRLYMPCSMDMQGLPSRRSTSTAWMFIATSIPAKLTPST